MRLADFISSNVEPILAEWEAFARAIAPAGGNMDGVALRDHAGDILLATAADMRSAQTAGERFAKSRGKRAGVAGAGGGGGGGGGGGSGGDGATLNGASELHAFERLGSGFDLLEVVSEYRALRASVLRLWAASGRAPHESDVDDVTRFNESIDQSVTKAVASYTRRVDQSRDLFLAILGHDLRNPLNSISMSALMPRPPPGRPNADTADAGPASFAAQIVNHAQGMARMIADLLDYTRTRLGAGMPVSPAPMDLGALGRELFDQFRAAHPERELRYQADGDLRGDWDADRLRQAVSNLLGNAVQHGAADAPIDLRLDGTAPDAVVVVVHNGGPPIPPGELPRIFDPLVRGSSAQHPKVNRPGSIGLGLYIAREVARSHGGGIDVTSSAAAGTAFTVTLPRRRVGG
jgi:signal transduction histidine kinase